MPEISKITLPSGTSYDIKDATARSDLSGKISAPTSPSSGDILTYNGTAWVADDPPAGVFYATFGTTTSAEVEAAYQAGKSVLCFYQWHVYRLAYRANSTSCMFSTVITKNNAYHASFLSLISDSWSYTDDVRLATNNSPSFTGYPTAPTAGASSNDTQIATTAFVKTAIANVLSGGVVFRGETTTALTDGATTNPITINGNSYTAVQGDLVISGKKEFVFDGTHWIELGDLDALGDLAWKDSASGSYTPAGTVSRPTFSGSSLTSTGKFTPAGSVSVSTNATTNKTAYVSPVSEALAATYTPEGTVSVQGSEIYYMNPITESVTSTDGIDITTSGTVSKPNVTVTKDTGSIIPFGSAGSLPTFSATVSNENLTFSFDAGTLPSAGTSVSVVTDVSAELASTPSFTPTSKYLKLEKNVLQSTGGARFSLPGTFAFSGKGVILKTSGIAVPNTYTATFTGTEGNVSVTGTPAGTVTQPTFSGTAATISVS